MYSTAAYTTDSETNPNKNGDNTSERAQAARQTVSGEPCSWQQQQGWCQDALMLVFSHAPKHEVE